MTDDAYLDGFVAGLEFVLLAMEGRGLEGPAVEAFRSDYRRVVDLYRRREGRHVPTTAIVAMLRN